MLNIGKLEEVDVRELWKHEERGFSAWLENNLDDLSDKIGIQLSDPQREIPAGNFQCDLVTTNANGDRVIIENQLVGTNHDHLGKLLTYVSNLDAKAAIWIATSQRPEHIRTVQWLNETTPDDVSFYMVKLSAFRMSGSDLAAPLFTVIVEPNAETKSFGRQKKDLAERHVLRLSFWDGLLALASKRGFLLHAQRSPLDTLYLPAGAGVQSGVSFTYLIWMQNSGVELYINNSDVACNESIFNSLLMKKGAIQEAFGGKLNWDSMKGCRARRIRYVISGGGLQNQDRWPSIQASMVDAMERLHKAIMPHINC